MTQNPAPNVSEVKDAILLTRLRDTPAGGLWLPELRRGDENNSIGQDAHMRKLRSIFLYRGPALRGALQQVVRLAHLMDRADARGYVGFLYLRLTRLTPEQFRTALSRAAMRGQLGEAFEVTQAGVCFLAPGMAGSKIASFELSYAQMPFLAAVLDVLHNALGYDAVQHLLAPVLGAGTGDALAVGKTLRTALEAWLHPRLDPEHLIKQRGLMRRYLLHLGIERSDEVTAERVRDFWCDFASRLGESPACGPLAALLEEVDGTVDGFRLIDHAVSLLMHYREALALARVEAGLDRAQGLGVDGDGQGGGSSSDGTLDRGSYERWQEWQSAEREAWQEEVPGAVPFEVRDAREAPLVELGQAPLAKVKWLTRKSTNFLWSGFGTTVDDAAAGRRKALFAHGDIPEGHWRSLLMVQSFAGVQNTAKGKALDAAAIHALARDNYFDLAQRYEEIFGDLRRALLAAAWLITRHDADAGLELAVSLMPEVIATQLRTALATLPPTDQAHAAARMIRDQLSSPNSALMHHWEKEGFALINRAGFGQAQVDDTLFAALLQGVAVVQRLLAQGDKLSNWMKHADLETFYAADAERVCARLAELYGSDGDAA